MAFFWFQQWVALPVVYEGPMGDLPPNSRAQALDSAATGFAHESPYTSSGNNTPFHSQLSAIHHNQFRPEYRSSAQPSAQYEHDVSSLNMGSMAATLTDHASVDEASVNPQSLQSLPQSVPRSLSGASTSALAFQLGQNLQIPAHASGGLPNHPYAAGPYPQQPFVQGSQHAVYPPFAAQPRMPGSSMQPAFQNYAQPSQYMYYSTAYGPQGQYNPGYSTHGAQVHAMYERRGSMAGASAGLTSLHNIDYQHHDSSFTGALMGSRGFQGDQATMGSAFNAPFVRAPGMPNSGPISSIPRGPPRKPKQSGHALWVGNLPPGTTVLALKDHFSREATKDIESLFLISKSNCAFVNYRSEASCTAAMHRFHDSRFNGVRLVCRLRRSSAPASGVPTGPSAMVGSQQINASPPRTPKVDGEAVDGLQDGVPESSDKGVPGVSNSSSKYFVVKSLTLQDLELSVRNGIWATQSHNEEILNKAFQSTENVYLIFSANKSGEYFGYARMISPILEDGSRLIGPAPKPENIMDAPDVPKSIPTPATEWAPRGKIIDDSARGTIFWEAELPEPEAEEDVAEREDRQDDGDNSAVAQSWGKPFKIEWLSTNRLPFYRTRGLRNPWNANREVKIARDGTELEPSVGDRLVQMFHRLGPSNAGAPMMAPHSQLGGPIIPQMRPF